MKGETNEEKYSIKKSKEINIWNNANSTCGNNACPLSITIKVSNINGWEYR